ncbi:Lys-63-specific deubiquitinase BRCC36 [Camelus dromedarius]|uniref:Lys-63-specific deubiquitinase BRCC36 n=1 Tax=Camelus dromedarius TaxID=9838 RepID=A0A5N4C1T1_CAMDR|nr:Lys-63-specific deubiquitinase BRCC36 [Camelus dromedarius]
MAVQVVQAVQAVHLESDAFLVCLNHALSTEKEEVMGLCIGELNDDTRSDPKFTYTGTEMRTVAEKVDSVRIVHIHSVIILRRSDKRKDRVEISPEQLSAASTEAEISFLVDETVFCALEAPLSFVCCFRRFHRFSSWRLFPSFHVYPLRSSCFINQNLFLFLILSDFLLEELDISNIPALKCPKIPGSNPMTMNSTGVTSSFLPTPSLVPQPHLSLCPFEILF